MRTSSLITTLIISLFFGTTIGVSQAEQTVYGWQLMTEQERSEHRAKMRSFQTEQEREAYRLEHHKQMQARARERGITLPDQPTPMGKGMRGPREGAGQGMGGGGGRYR